MKIDITFYTKAVEAFKTAPTNFYSPVGRHELLNQEEIDLRTNFCVHSFLIITPQEKVFRKFWEISKLSKADWIKAFKVALEFLERNNLNQELVIYIIKDLTKEIHALKKSNGRSIHNPFNS